MSIKKKAKSGMLWSFLNQGTTQIINFAITLLLARLLMPEDYGLIGLISVFIVIGRSLTDAGFSSSLIRTKKVDDGDYSTVFFINLLSSIILYIIIFFSSPYIADFFEEPVLENLIKIMALIFLINASSIVQSTKLNKSLQFKEQFKLQLIALIISSGFAVYLALNDYGVWSLVIKDISYALLASIQLWIYSRWIPKLRFDINKLKYHFNFGYKLLIADIISKIFNNSYNVVIGKFISTSQLGLFTRAKSMEELPNNIIFNAINKVLYPLLAEVNENDEKLKRVYRQIMSLVALFTIPILVYMSLIAEPLFVFLLTDKWVGAVPYFQILIIVALLSPFQKYNLNICKIKGRSDLVLQLSVVEYLLIFISLFSVVYYGIYGLLWGMVLATTITVVYTSFKAGKLINYSVKEQFSDIFKPFFTSVILGIITYFLLKFTAIGSMSNFYILIISSFSFFSIYLIMGYMWNKNKFKDLYRILTNK